MFSSFSSTPGICEPSIGAMHAKPARHRSADNARAMDATMLGSVRRESEVCFLLSNTYARGAVSLTRINPISMVRAAFRAAELSGAFEIYASRKHG